MSLAQSTMKEVLVHLFRDAWRLILIGIGIIVVVAACGGVKLGELASSIKPAAGNGDSRPAPERLQVTRAPHTGAWTHGWPPSLPPA